MVGDPVVHGVAADEPDVGHGLTDAELEDRIDVGEEEEVRVLVAGGDLGGEVGEDVEAPV